MPVFSKIPKKLKEQSVANGGFVVFGNLMEVGPVFNILNAAEKVPSHGYLKLKNKKFYYCRIAIFEDEKIYN